MTRYVFTSANVAYRPKVAALAASVKRHEPDVLFVWAVVERSQVPAGNVPGVDEYLRLDQLGQDWEHHLAGRSVVEACTAVKGGVLATLLSRPDCAEVVYLDPDIWVYGPLEPVWAALALGSIVLTPHMLAPSATAEGIRDNELNSLKHGIYNLGFLAVKADAIGRSFAKWWDTRLWDYCRIAPAEGLFTDQRWVDHVPVFFDQVHILRHDGCNVANWNLGERYVHEVNSQFFVGSAPLVFWHFSSVDHQAHIDMTEKYAQNDLPMLISEQYRAALSGYEHDYGAARARWSLAGPVSPMERAKRGLRAASLRYVDLISRSALGPIVRCLVPKYAREVVRRRLLEVK